jgi:membrane protein DedA with SNARE-associated domain
MSPQHITELTIEYRYWILVPFVIIEGPIVAFIAGTLASIGYFNIYALIIFFFVRDMAMDAVFYYAGYMGAQTRFAKRMLGKINQRGDTLKDLRTQWEKHPARTMFVGKLSFGIAQAFIVAAGVVNMRLSTFFTYGAVVAVTQYITLLTLGYFFGDAFGGDTTRIVQNIQYVIAVSTLLISGYYLLRWYLRRKFREKT